MNRLITYLSKLGILLALNACGSPEPVATKYKRSNSSNSQIESAAVSEEASNDEVSEIIDILEGSVDDDADEEAEADAENAAEVVADVVEEKEPTPEELAAMEAVVAEQARIASVAAGKAIYELAGNNCMGCHQNAATPANIDVANLNLQIVVAAAAKAPHAGTMAIFQDQVMAQAILDLLKDAAGLNL